MGCCSHTIPGSSDRAPFLPPVVHVDCTGLGGRDLGGPHTFNLRIRTDKHGQGVYGPSVAALDTIRYHHRCKTNVVPMGSTKAMMHEFLVLHDFAMDFFCCWQLLGYVPGGAPFSQLNIGVTDAMAIIKS